MNQNLKLETVDLLVYVNVADNILVIKNGERGSQHRDLTLNRQRNNGDFSMADFDNAIAALDLSLFEKIESQSTDEDKRSLLACQSAVRDLRPEYTYLEIGSYLGGSIQPHLVDERCKRIVSIDKRPPRQPDARGVDYEYLNNST